MPIGKYFWPRTFLSNEWIVSRNVSIAIQSEDFPEIAVQILRCIAISETVRDGHQKCPIRQKNHSAAGVPQASLFRTGGEYPFSAAQAGAVKFRPKDGQVILLLGTFVKGDKDGVVRLESGVEHHIQQPTVALLQNILRSPGNRRRIQNAFSKYAQLAEFFGHKRVTVRQKRQTPREFLSLCGHPPLPTRVAPGAV